MRKLNDEFDGLAAGKESPSAQSAFKGIVLVDCDGTLFDVKGEPENNPLFDALIAAIKNGFAVVVHSGDPDSNALRVMDVLARRDVNAYEWIHANVVGDRHLVWDKLHSPKVVKALNPQKSLPLLIVDDDMGFVSSMTKIYNIMGYKIDDILPTDTAALETFANITESSVNATHITFEALN